MVSPVLPLPLTHVYRFGILIHFYLLILVFFNVFEIKTSSIKYNIQAKPPPFVSSFLTILINIFIQLKSE